MDRRGSSLIEALLSMCLLAVATLAGLEAFSAGRRVFFRMDAAEERDTRAAAGLDRARLDAREAGGGLADAIRLGFVAGIAAAEQGFIVASLDKAAEPGGSIAAGDDFIPLTDTTGFATGRMVCLLAADGGEARTVSAVLIDGIRLSAPLGRGYPAGEAVLLLIRTVEIFLDEGSVTLRRRVNGSSAQPLIENVADFSCRLDDGAKTITMELCLEGGGNAIYAATVLGKNLWLNGSRDEE
jgi:hypothetical protein